MSTNNPATLPFKIEHSNTNTLLAGNGMRDNAVVLPITNRTLHSQNFSCINKIDHLNE